MKKLYTALTAFFLSVIYALPVRADIVDQPSSMSDGTLLYIAGIVLIAAVVILVVTLILRAVRKKNHDNKGK